MIICINPFCQSRSNPYSAENCESCGNSLIINNKYILLNEIGLIHNEHREIFEVLECNESSDKKSANTNIMKVLKPSDNPTYSERLEMLDREAFALSKLQHPGIPELISHPFTFVLKDNYLKLRCIVMEKIGGINLEDYILQTQEPISQSLALDWLEQLVNILDYIHSRGFIHRDIKPSNIMLKSNGQLVLIDFGGVQEINGSYLCEISSDFKNFSDSPSPMSEGFSPPEQIRGRAVPQSDFYALGRTFVSLATKVNPLSLPKEINSDKLIWRDKARQIDRSFANFIDCLMELDVGKRPLNTQIISQFLEDRSTSSSIQLSQVDKDLSISGKVELSITLIVNTLPTNIFRLENNRCEFSIYVGRQLFVILAKNKIIKKLEQFQEIYPHWEVALSSKKWKKMLGIYFIYDPNFKTLYLEEKK